MSTAHRFDRDVRRDYFGKLFPMEIPDPRQQVRLLWGVCLGEQSEIIHFMVEKKSVVYDSSSPWCLE